MVPPMMGDLAPSPLLRERGQIGAREGERENERARVDNTARWGWSDNGRADTDHFLPDVEDSLPSHTTDLMRGG